MWEARDKAAGYSVRMSAKPITGRKTLVNRRLAQEPGGGAKMKRTPLAFQRCEGAASQISAKQIACHTRSG